MGDITLLVEGKTFIINIQTLCEYSDYFRAMFSGNYAETNKREISIDIVDAKSMEIIVTYMRVGLIDLSEFSLSTIGELATAADFLQMTELIKQIIYTLELQLGPNNWVEIMNIAENSCFKKLEQYVAAFALLSFKKVQTQVIKCIKKLHWYLSHPYIDSQSELDIFKFGLKWVLENETGADALLIILGCLDVNRLSGNDIYEMLILIKDFENSLAAKVLECLGNLFQKVSEITLDAVIEYNKLMCEEYSERVYNEVYCLVKDSNRRKLALTPTVPMLVLKENRITPADVPHYLYSFNEGQGFVKWLEVAEKDLWGWSVAPWGPTKLVVVCGESGKGKGVYMKDVKVYDILKEEWIHHGVELPPRRHCGVAILDDSLFIIGGVSGFRSVLKLWAGQILQVVMDSVLIYNLKDRAYRKTAKLPDVIQNPAVCAHNGHIYCAGQVDIFKYIDFGTRDTWMTAATTDFRINCMVSYKDHVYCTHNYSSDLYRFNPNEDNVLERIFEFKNRPAAMCNVGNRLIVFTRSISGLMDDLELAVEEYRGKDRNEEAKVIWSDSNSELKVYDVAGSCSLVLYMPPLYPQVSCYAEQYLKRYT